MDYPIRAGFNPRHTTTLLCSFITNGHGPRYGGVPVPAVSSPSGTASFVDHLALVPLQFTGQFLHWAIVFFVLAIIAAVLGARGVAGVTMTIAKWFVIIFLVLAIISAVL